MRTVFGGGTVITADPARPRATAVAVEDGRIVALDDAALGMADASAAKVDLAGRCLVPGFHDGHIHPRTGGIHLAEAPIADATSVDDLRARIRAYAAANPALPWVRGFGYPPALFPDAIGDKALLDDIVPDRPAFFWAADGHTAWVNSKALEHAGITSSTPNPPLGTIARRGDGTPIGALLEAAQDLVVDAMPAYTADEKKAGIGAALAQLRAAGITWAQDAWAEADDPSVYVDVAKAGGLTARMNVALRALPGQWERQRDSFLAAREAAERAVVDTGGRAVARTIKFFADGIIETGTAALLEPYCDHPESCGIPNWSAEELAAAVTAFDADGFQIHIHAIGDAGIRNALDAIEVGIRRNGPRDRRAVIAHTQLVDPADLPRFAQLGVIANFEPFWARLDPVMVDLTIPRLGPERSAYQYPIRSMLASGAPVSFGSDWPVSTMVPMEGIAVAVTRQTDEGDPADGWLPEEKVSLDQAIAAYTAGGAYQAFRDHDAGRIAPGYVADLVVLAADIEAMRGVDLAGVPVDATYLGGEIVFAR